MKGKHAAPPILNVVQHLRFYLLLTVLVLKKLLLVHSHFEFISLVIHLYTVHLFGSEHPLQLQLCDETTIQNPRGMGGGGVKVV